MYVITGATGQTGNKVAEKLLAQGEQVRVVGRDAKRLEPFVRAQRLSLRTSQIRGRSREFFRVQRECTR